MLRSHKGCARCKRRRQKCDEGRPSCLRCIGAETVCEYRVTLKWDGRVPRPIKRPRERQSTISKQSPTRNATFSDLNTSRPVANHIQRYEHHPEALTFRELDFFKPWTSIEKLLWHHYMTRTSMIASHSDLRDQIFRQILPIAIQSPSLMYGILALSALHRSTLFNEPSHTYIPEATTSGLISKSLKHLRRELENPQPQSRYLLLHTIRTLCVCEIYTGKADSSWRIHVDGAKTILASLNSRGHDTKMDEHGWLTSRWYESMQALAALTDRGVTHDIGQQNQPLGKHYDLPWSPNYFLDIYTGYSSDLNDVFKRIGLLALEQQQALISQNADELRSLELQLDRLESLIEEMIRRDSEQGLKLPLDISVTRDELKQFVACNTAYQHTALLHIHRRLRNRGIDSKEVQASVQRILEAVCGILPMKPLSPWALLTTPIFFAGCVLCIPISFA